MMKTIKKILILLIFITIWSLIFNTTILATNLGTAVDNADSFVQNGGSNSILNPQGIYDTMNFIYGLLVGIGIIFAIIKGIIIGIQIIFGSLQDKADAKALIIPYLWIVGGIAFGSVILRAILTAIMTATANI